MLYTKLPFFKNNFFNPLIWIETIMDINLYDVVFIAFLAVLFTQASVLTYCIGVNIKILKMVSVSLLYFRYISPYNAILNISFCNKIIPIYPFAVINSLSPEFILPYSSTPLLLPVLFRLLLL